ncbi:MAG: hypothetical protein MUC38_12060 [Cyclobacteriaceae bacterium]|nr:hypothetical protein [Cyclobacteriaceae bacterium]
MTASKLRWWLFSGAGLALTGMGLALAIDAGFAKVAGRPWIAYGTVALVVFNTGLALFGRGVAEYVWRKKG